MSERARARENAVKYSHIRVGDLRRKERGARGKYTKVIISFGDRVERKVGLVISTKLIVKRAN